MVKKNLFIKLIISLPYFALIILNMGYMDFSGILSIYTLFVLIILLFKFRNHQPLFLVILFITTYSIMPALYFLFQIQISAYKLFADYQFYSETLNYQSLLIGVLYVFIIPPKNNSIKIVDKIKVYDNILLFYINIFIIVLIIIFGKTGVDVFTSGGYGKNATNIGGTAIWEYVLIFVMASFIFSGRKKNRIAIILILSLIYIIKDMLLGGRIASLQLIILIFILFFENKFSKKVFILSILSGFSVFFVYGAIRNNPEKFLSDISQLKFDPYTLLSNQGEVFYSSTLLVSLVNQNIIDLSFRLKSLVGNIISLFMPSRFVFYEADIIWVASRRLGGCGGGGMISSYFYVWGGLLGLLLVGKYISTIFNYIYKNTNIYITTYSILVMSTVPRWYAYKPLALFKLSFYIIPVLFILLIIHKQMSYSHK